MTNDPIERNRELARNFFQEVWNNADEQAIDRYIAVDAAGNDDTFGAGREAFRSQWRKWHAAFTGLHFEVEEIVAEAGKVVTRWTLTGKHTGEFLGIPATGRSICVTGMSLDHIANGQITAGFDAWNQHTLHHQLTE